MMTCLKHFLFSRYRPAYGAPAYAPPYAAYAPPMVAPPRPRGFGVGGGGRRYVSLFG